MRNLEKILVSTAWFCLLVVLCLTRIETTSSFFVGPTVSRCARHGSIFVADESKFTSSATTRARPICVTSLQMIPDSHFASHFVTTAVEVFDGSGIVDPVVVSNAFWGSFQSKVISFLIGQLLAVLAFTVITSLAAQQLTNIGTYLSENVFKGNTNNSNISGNQQGSATANTKKYTVQPDVGKLLICIVVDVVGTSSELIPVLGEVTDIVWAPIAGLILRSLYGSNVIFALEFAEEILPFTDILPLATICWVVDTFFYDSDLARILQLGRYKPFITSDQMSTDTIIDVKTTDSTNTRRLESSKD